MTNICQNAITLQKNSKNLQKNLQKICKNSAKILQKICKNNLQNQSAKNLQKLCKTNYFKIYSAWLLKNLKNVEGERIGVADR